MTITLKDQIAELKREAAIRARVYPKWVEAGRMKLDHAEWNQACLSAAISTLERLANARPGFEEQPCPGNRETTVRQCVDAGECGCIYGDVVKDEQSPKAAA